MESPKAAKLLKVEDTPEFQKFYNLFPDLTDREKFIRSLAYRKYPEILEGAEEFVTLDFCLERAVELNDTPLIDYFTDKLTPKDAPIEALTILAKKGDVNRFMNIFTKVMSSKKRVVDVPTFLYYVGNFPESKLEEIRKIMMKYTTDDIIEKAVVDNCFYIGAVAVGREKLTKAKMEKMLDVIETFVPNEFAEILAEAGKNNAVYKLVNIVEEIAPEESKDLEASLGIILLTAAIKRGNKKDAEAIINVMEMPDRSRDLHKLFDAIGFSKYPWAYELIHKKYGDRFDSNIYNFLQSTSPVFGKVSTTLEKLREFYSEPFIGKHLNDPLAIAVYLRDFPEMGENLRDSYELENLNENNEVKRLVKLEDATIYKMIANIFGY